VDQAASSNDDASAASAVHKISPVRYSRPLTNPQREQAVQLLAADVLTDERVAERCGISRRMLMKWKKNAAFVRRLEFLMRTFADRALLHGIAARDKRVEAGKEDYERLTQVIQARASDPIMKRVTGGDTGALVLTGYETTYMPKKRTTVDAEGNVREEEYLQKQSAPVFAVDAPLFKMRQEIRQEIGRETGQLPNETPIGAFSVTINQNQYNLAIKRALGLADDEMTQVVDVAVDQQLPAGVDFDPESNDAQPAGVEP
jgi:transcriptional regulator with XRE-family HTH domain